MFGKNFSILWEAALAADDREAYVSEWSRNAVWGNPERKPADIQTQIAGVVGNIWDVAHISVKDLCKVADMSQAAFAHRFCIPKRTLESWCGSQTRPCPNYIRLMMAEVLGLLDRYQLEELRKA